ncbi:MAG: hypothetical protein WDO13_19800 [Verrucomicrobiota bacterium]
MIVVVGYEMVAGVAPTDAQAIAIYGLAVLLVTALTTLYTAVGGIRAVVWTDVIQATVMGGAVLYALGSLLVGVGGWARARQYLTQPGDLQFFDGGFGLGPTTPSGALDLAHGHPVLGAISGILGNEYTIWAALLGSVFTTMATHGTDQDMVQRMLTAKDLHKSRLALVLSGLVDIPVAMGFLFIGILIYVFYQMHRTRICRRRTRRFSPIISCTSFPPARAAAHRRRAGHGDGFAEHGPQRPGHQLHGGFLVPYFARRTDEHHIVQAVRWSTVVFAVLLAAVGTGTAAVVVYSPHARIIPIVLGIFRLHLRLAARHLPARPDHEGPRHRLRQRGGDDLRLPRCRRVERLPWDLVNAARGQSFNISHPVIMLLQSGLGRLQGRPTSPRRPGWYRSSFPGA